MEKKDIKSIISEIKENEDLDKTATFTDLISKKEYKTLKKVIKKEDEAASKIENTKTNKNMNNKKVNKKIKKSEDEIKIKFEENSNLEETDDFNKNKSLASYNGIILLFVAALYIGYIVLFGHFNSVSFVIETIFLGLLCFFYAFTTASSFNSIRFGRFMVMLTIISYFIYKVLILSEILKI